MKGKRGFQKKQEGETADPNIWRGGRNYYNRTDTKLKKNDEDMTYRDLGRLELLRLFKKMKPHTKDAILLMAALMNKESAEDTIRLKAALAFITEFRNLSKEIYDSEELITPEDAELETKPAAVLQLHVVNKLDAAIRQAEKENELNKE